MNKKTLTGFSMFSGAGIGEMLLSKKRFNIKIDQRSYCKTHRNKEVINLGIAKYVIPTHEP